MPRSKQPIPELLNDYYADRGGYAAFLKIMKTVSPRLRPVEIAYKFKVSENTARLWLLRHSQKTIQGE